MGTRRWRKGDLIGSGAFGQVYLGMDLDSGELLAIKQVWMVSSSATREKAHECFDRAHVRELENKVKLLKNLSHPNIVQYIGTVREDNSLNVPPEFVPGGSIQSLLGRLGAFSKLGMASALETLCGQAYGAKKYHMLGVYLQRSWVVLLIFAAALTPTYVFMEDLLLLLGQTPELARLAGQMSIWLLPQHFAMAMLLPLTRFLQSQLKNWVTAVTAGVALAIHVVITYLLVHHFKLGLVGAVASADLSWWIVVLGQLFYVVGGGCPLSWKGFSMEAFADFWDFIKLSTASGVMLCLENWYYRVLVLLTGYLQNAEIAVDALSICLTINGWEMMIPLGFLAATGVRVANELGAGSGKGARFSIIVSITTSVVIGLVFWCLILTYNDQIALLFSSGKAVLDAVHNLSVLLAFTILLNSVQPVLSGVAIGSGWQALVAYVNIGSYYLVGVPIGVILGWPLGFGVRGIWSGLIGGTAVQTLVLSYLTMRCDWDEEAKTASTRMKKWASTK